MVINQYQSYSTIIAVMVVEAQVLSMIIMVMIMTTMIEDDHYIGHVDMDICVAVSALKTHVILRPCLIA